MLDFDAGKYAPYVWGAYAVTAVTFLGMIVRSLVNAARWRRAADEAERRARR
jgi:heme exporter protein D